jgi:hypothetical protein
MFQEKCLEEGGYLLEVNSMEENNWIINTLAPEMSGKITLWKKTSASKTRF